jgi:hypothetical protein
MPVSSTLPDDTDEVAILVRVLAQRWRKKANKTVEQVLSPVVYWGHGGGDMGGP